VRPARTISIASALVRREQLQQLSSDFDQRLVSPEVIAMRSWSESIAAVWPPEKSPQTQAEQTKPERTDGTQHNNALFAIKTKIEILDKHDEHLFRELKRTPFSKATMDP
jgi:predicted RNase H-like nuclease (RuvC/YqgF family)